MKRNVHKVERVVRVIAGLGILSLTVIGPHSPWGLLGIVPLATGIAGWCPPYAVLGIRTCGKSC